MRRDSHSALRSLPAEPKAKTQGGRLKSRRSRKVRSTPAAGGYPGHRRFRWSTPGSSHDHAGVPTEFEFFNSQLVGGSEWLVSRTNHRKVARLEGKRWGLVSCAALLLHPAGDRFKLKGHRETRQLSGSAGAGTKDAGSVHS